MTHSLFIIAAYGLGLLVPLAYALDALRRVRVVRRRLAAVDPRLQGRTRS